MENVIRCEPRPLGPVSEAMFVRDMGDCPHSGYSYMTFRGRLDLEAMKEAVRSAQAAFPVLVMRLEERRVGMRHLLMRVPIDEPPPLRVVEDYAGGLGGLTVFEALKRRFEPRYLKFMDLYREPPCEFFLFVFPDSEYALATYFHHIGTDGGNMMELFRRLFAAYHEKVAGSPPDWAAGEVLASSAGKATRNYSTLKVFRQMIAEARNRKKHPVIRFGNADRITSAKRNIVRVDLTEEETREMIKKAKASGLTVNDLLSGAIIRAIDAVMDTPHGTFSFWIPVNVRGVGKGREGRTNYSSSVNIDLIRDERLDEKKMMEVFVARRKEQLDMGRAYINLKLLELLLGAARFFPVKKRMNPLKRLFSQPMTFMSSNLGVLWPKRVDGRLTSESALTHAGELEITDYMANFSTEDNIGHGLVMWTYLGRFSAAFSAYEQVLTRQESETLMSRIKSLVLR